MSATLEDHLRRATRNFTAPLPEDDLLALGADLARELARAHGETPLRHPDLDPAAAGLVDGKPRLDKTAATGSEAEDLFLLGALLSWLATTTRPDVSWRLDGAPMAALSTIGRRAVLAALTAPARAERFATAAEAAQALDAVRAAAPTTEPPWPSFRGDAARSGARPSPAPSALEPLWHARVGAIVSSPVVADDAVLVPTADGRLVFLEPTTGRRLHEVRLGTAVESTPALAAGVAFVGTDEGDVVAIDARAGDEQHRVRLGQMVRSSPLVADGRVVVGTVDSKTAGALVALDSAKGKLLWARKLGAVFSSPALAGDRMIVGSDDGSLHAVDVARGSLAWSHRLGAKVRATPAVSADLAIAGDFAGLLVAVRLVDGTRAWARETGHALYSSACIAGDLVVVGCREGHVHGFDRLTGEPRFETATRGPIVSSPVSVGGRFLVGATDGGLYLLAGDGSLTQRVEVTPAGVQSSVALAGDTAYVGSGDGLHAFRLRI